jgi:hypothetical protein
VAAGNPVDTLITIGKSDSQTNNNQLTHTITGNVVKTAGGTETSSRITVCPGTLVTITVNDRLGKAIFQNVSGGLTCVDGTLTTDGVCTGVIGNSNWKYTVVSSAGNYLGSDTDRMTILPARGFDPVPTPEPVCQDLGEDCSVLPCCSDLTCDEGVCDD